MGACIGLAIVATLSAVVGILADATLPAILSVVVVAGALLVASRMD